MVTMIDDGISRIGKIISHFSDYKPSDIILVEGLRNFGDTLHASMIVRHFRKQFPSHLILWGVSDRYWKEFNEYAQSVGVVVFPLPHEATPSDRQAWKKHCSTLGLFKSVFPLCAVSGYDKPGNIVDNVIANAGITKLSVSRKPFFPHGINDYQWCDKFIIDNDLKGKKYVLLEYNSYTLSQPPHECIWATEKYNKLLELIKCPVVWTAAKTDRGLDKGLDARGCTWRQAKVLIERAACMIGCGSGLSVLAACDGLKTKVFELNIGPALALKNIYGHDSLSIKTDDPSKLASVVNNYIESKK